MVAAGSQGAARESRRGPDRWRCKNPATHCPAEAMQIDLVTNGEFVAARTVDTKEDKADVTSWERGWLFAGPSDAASAGTQCRRGQRGRQCSWGDWPRGGERARRTILLQCTWEYATVREFFVTASCHMKDAAWPLQVGGRCIVGRRDTFIPPLTAPIPQPSVSGRDPSL